MNMHIAVVSYTAAALAFSLVTLLLLTSWRGRSQGALLTLACAVSAAGEFGSQHGRRIYADDHCDAVFCWAVVCAVRIGDGAD